MKRREHLSDSSDAEMEVDNEEKRDRDAVDSDLERDSEEENNEPCHLVSEGELGIRMVDPFLDSFYGLTSTDPVERSQAAQVMLHHCLLGPNANSKDAAYALKRLLNGLCSGRAASRQGMASALATFLKLSFRLGRIPEIRNENETADEKELTDLAFLRSRLVAATESGDLGGKRKGAEERDYQFGRLFGINAVIRSSILLPLKGGKEDGDDVVNVSCGFASDLIELYQAKKWMREPAAHAIATLLNSFYSISENNPEAQKIAQRIVENIVVPQLLAVGDLNDHGSFPLFSTYSAEQAAVAINIQSNMHHHNNELPSPLNKPILSKDVIESIAQVLSETSGVAQPRTHLVWDAIFEYLTESGTGRPAAKVELRKIRKSCPFGNDSIEDLIAALIQHVVIEKLLGIQQSDTQGKAVAKTTHERRALALCIIRNLVGVEYVSSLAGRTKLVLESQVIESVLFTPVLIKNLFLDVLSAGSSKGKQQAAHLLKPLSLQVLESIVLTALDPNDDIANSDNTSARRLTFATSLIRCDPRFDAATKTTTVATLLGIGNNSVIDDSHLLLLDQFVLFAEMRVAATKCSSDAEPSTEIQSYESVGYVDLIYHIGKEMLKSDTTKENGLSEPRRSSFQKILSFLMVAAFFDCKSLDENVETPGKKKKKNRKKSIDRDPLTEIAQMVKSTRAQAATSILPYDVRSLASARFFSLLSSFVALVAHTNSSDKEAEILKLISDLNLSCASLVMAGATKIAPSSNTDDRMDTDEENPQEIANKLQDAARHPLPPGASKAQSIAHRLSIRFALLASTLYLHMLNCGRTEAEPEDDDPDADEDEDREEIISLLNDVNHVHDLFLTRDMSGENPMRAHAELCANILSGHLGRGSQSRGASPSLVRDVVKMTWAAGLSFAATNLHGLIVDSSVIDILLNAIGATDGAANEGIDERSDDESDLEQDESNDEEGKNNLSHNADSDESIGANDDVELDPKGLQSLLEEGSDAEINDGDLEHHAGADGALARLIQLKQDARKAGQLALERAEIGRQLRCCMLVETMFVGKSDAWGTLLRVDTVMEVVAPILRYRRELMKSLMKAIEKGSALGQREKRELANRLGSLLKTKVLKTKVPGHLWTENVDVSEFSQAYASKILTEAKSNVDKEQQSLCNGALMYLIRNITDTQIQLNVASHYSDAVTAWSEKRSKRLESSFFEDFVKQSPVIAQACLTPALATAALTGKTTYLKSESFKLLSMLINSKLNSNESEMEKIALKTIAEATGMIMEAIVVSLQDTEMKQTKRVRDVLALLEKVATCEVSACNISGDRRNEVIASLEKLNDNSQSAGVMRTIGKVIGLCRNVPSTSNAESTSKSSSNDADGEDDDDAPHNEQSDAVASKRSSKSKKKKKSKNKR